MSTSLGRWNDKLAVVTGASSGIGAAIAENLVEAGLKYWLKQSGMRNDLILTVVKSSDRHKVKATLKSKMSTSLGRWNDKLAVVTGASSGIGAAIAENLVEAGLKVVGLARRVEKIEELATKLKGKPGTLFPIKADICNEADILDAFAWIKANIGPVHILINSAGIFHFETLMDSTTKFCKDTFDTNVLGLCITTRAAVGDMRANNIAGHIIHINSIAGHKGSFAPGMDSMNVYAASKFAVSALTETLRQELRSVGSNIKITSISPGIVDSEILNASLMASGINLDILESYKSTSKLSSQDMADAVNCVLSTPPHVQVHELIIEAIACV